MGVPDGRRDGLTDGTADSGPEGEEGDGEGDVLVGDGSLRRHLRSDDGEGATDTGEDLGEDEASNVVNAVLADEETVTDNLDAETEL